MILSLSLSPLSHSPLSLSLLSSSSKACCSPELYRARPGGSPLLVWRWLSRGHPHDGRPGDGGRLLHLQGEEVQGVAQREGKRNCQEKIKLCHKHKTRYQGSDMKTTPLS